MSDTLARVLGKFNLDPRADYSKVTMPLTLLMNRTELASLFAELGFTVGAEIGTAAGDYAETLCKANPDLLLLHCVDKWQPYHGYTDHTHKTTLDGFYNDAKARLAPYPVFMHREWSLEAAKEFEDGSLDFVYIDANHRYEYVVADIAAWLPKVRSGGCIAGHDFNQSRQSRKKLFGVVEAVTGWCSAYNVAPWFVCKGEWVSVGDKTPSWFWVKP